MKSVVLSRFIPDFERVYTFEVPSSKSILNRALLWAAFTEGDTLVKCSAFGQDTQAILNCLAALEIKTETTNGGILVHGTPSPRKEANLNVGSAGTCARFLPAILACMGGNYHFDSSAQMKSRPMEFLIELEKAGVQIEYADKKYQFPFRIRSHGFCTNEFRVDTDVSTQYASALLLAGALGNSPVKVQLCGERVQGSYIKMTLALLKEFGCKVRRDGNAVTVSPIRSAPREIEVEPDLSAACYFYALALAFGIKVLVRKVKKNSLQGDTKFLDLLSARGVTFTQTDDGLLADGSKVTAFEGFSENFNDFSDQTLTAAALAPFASTPSCLTGIGHIRKQECDRIAAIEQNLQSLGVECHAETDSVRIQPSTPTGGQITTFSDHRVAMAFALTALKIGGVKIDDATCCEKTFSEYFEQLNRLFD